MKTQETNRRKKEVHHKAHKDLLLTVPVTVIVEGDSSEGLGELKEPTLQIHIPLDQLMREISKNIGVIPDEYIKQGKSAEVKTVPDSNGKKAPLDMPELVHTKSDAPGTKKKKGREAKYEAKNKQLDKYESFADQNRFICYQKMDAFRRDQEFVHAYVRLVRKYYSVTDSWKLHMLAKYDTLKDPKWRYHIRKGRIAADCAGARYDDYILAIILAYQEGKFPHRTFIDIERIAGDKAKQVYEEYEATILGLKVRFTRDEIKANLGFEFLAENYTGTPEQKAIVEGLIFPEFERMHRYARCNLWDALHQAVRDKIIPQAWLEDPLTQQKIRSLKGYKYEGPRRDYFEYYACKD